jgi:hypothetical protein
MTIILILTLLVVAALYCFGRTLLDLDDPFDRMIADELAWDSKLNEFYITDPPLDRDGNLMYDDDHEPYI